MKVKELHKTVNVAWSPPSQYPILLAAGTAAQQLDASFDTNASLDLYSLNLQQPGYDMELRTSVPSDQRFHKLVWSSDASNPAGIIVGGCDYGKIKIYSVAKMLTNDTNCLISSSVKHNGPVRAMDFNPFKPHLLATGATESEIYIWDLNNTAKPMTPGGKSTPDEDVQDIAWNKQVQHILASTFSQRCVIWDLKKNEAIIKLSDVNSKVRWKSVQWHPDVATQLCLASEDDQSPIIELWDLRFATSPLKTLHNHQRGVLSIAWNPHDSDLLLSCAKDNRILCWNPNSDAANGEVTCELAQTHQFNFDVSWCPRNPGLIVGTSADGLATVYSLLGGHNHASAETTNKIVDSFPGMDPFTQAPPIIKTESAAVLKKAPKWLKRPFGASFGFGGKLTIFENDPVDPNMPSNANRKAYISQVVTDPILIQRSNELEAALKNNLFGNFCQNKIDTAPDELKRKIWSCVNAYFGENVTHEILSLLGHNIDEMNNKLNQFVPRQEVEALTDGISKLNNNINGFDGSAAFDAIAEQEQRKSITPTKASKSVDTGYRISTSDDSEGLITQAILLGNIEAAVALCFENNRYADAIILSMAGGPDLLAKTQYRYFNEHSGALNSLINSVVSENWVDLVKNCDITSWKEALVGIFTHISPAERGALCDILGDRLAASENDNFKKEAQICYICSGNLNKAVESSDTGIQETVEFVMILKKALEFHTTHEVIIDGSTAAVLTRYAEMLASEGDLDAALNYLGNSQEPGIVMLRDRLYKALGHISMEPQRQNLSQNTGYAQPNIYAQNQALPKKSLPGSAQSTFAPIQQIPASVQPLHVPSWNTAPTKQPYGSQPYGTAASAPINQFTPAPPMSSQPADAYTNFGQQPMTPAVPPPPPAVNQNSGSLSGSRPSSVGPQSKSKYILDPSVKSGPTYGTTGYGQNQSIYSNPIQTQPFSSPGSFPAQTPYMPQQPQVMGNFGGYGTSPAQSTIYNSTESELQQRPMQPSMLNPNTIKPQSIYDPSALQQNVQPSQLAGYPNENQYQPEPQPSGWNDPPIMKSAKPQQKTQFQQQNPIQHPLRGTAPPQPEPTVYQQDSGFHQHSYQQDQQAMYNQFNQYNHNIPAQGVPGMPGVPQYNRPAEPPVQLAQIVRAPEPEKPKAPIPEEHRQLQTIFNELKDQCFEKAKNPQIKRKIDDVSKKLEVFYDCLREQKISPNTLQGLHQISNAIQTGDYPGGLAVHTQLVSGPDFSLIASFMPGIKVLLQVALQLGSYIR
ncbi:protein transport protein Sec31A isoform X2 [Phymastichus coffea]|uniref:protein transport protein Sec31A isoform X2 n=1 Tax=Phymastichus coffea TaxID=108790 RepID=UPI00273C6CB1|nr:protein transport protein Sec31A isoform X2 [Phymastichus coffea]